MCAHQARARALPPDERRAAIISAALPLMATHGATFTTKQLAEAANIAEGTIFRVFADKETLINAAIDAAFDSQALVQQLSEIDRHADLETRLEQAVALIQDRVQRLFRLMSALDLDPKSAKKRSTGVDAEVDALALLFDTDPHVLRYDPITAARVLRGLAFAGTHPMFTPDTPMTPTQIVETALYGLVLTQEMGN